ncbi:chromosome segregation protein Spc25-domain-containing protein [Dipodascopsis uninucleata]
MASVLQSKSYRLDNDIGDDQDDRARLNSPSTAKAPAIPEFAFNFDVLRKTIDSFQSRFDEYITFDRKKVLSERNAFEQEMAECKEQQLSILKQIEHYKERESEIEQERARERQEVLETERSISDFTQKKQELMLLKDAVDKQVRETQMILERKREERAKERSKFLAQSSQNAPELIFWEHNLGMRIEGVQDDYLKIVFTLISEASWNKEYYIIVDLSARDYEITKCVPELEKSTLDVITMRLNESRDFSRFLKEVRKAFKDSVL